jgi:hypothetical protein
MAPAWANVRHGPPLSPPTRDSGSGTPDAS